MKSIDSLKVKCKRIWPSLMCNFEEKKSGQISFLKKGSIVMRSVFSPVIISASRRFFWAIKNDYYTIFPIFYRFREASKVTHMTSRAPSLNPKQIFQPYRPKMNYSNQVWLIWNSFANLYLFNPKATGGGPTFKFQW